MTPPVVLLHGVGLDHRMWEPVASVLRVDHDVRAPDLLGHGDRASAPAGITLDDLVGAVLNEVPASSVVVGFSLGALVAQQLALRLPDRVAALVSVASVCRRNAQERASVLSRFEVAKSDYAASIDASVTRWYDGTDVSDEWVVWTRKRLASNNVDSFLNCYRVFATGDAEVGPRLGELSVPAIAITGSDDPGSTPEMSRRLADAIPGCRVVIVDGARHMLPVQRSAELTDALTEFIGGIIDVRA